MSYLESALKNLHVESYSGRPSLKLFAKIVGLETARKNKQGLIDGLLEVLEDPEQLKELWEKCLLHEKDLLYQLLKDGDNLTIGDVHAIWKHHGVPVPRGHTFAMSSYVSSTSPILIFLFSPLLQEVQEMLLEIIPEPIFSPKLAENPQRDSLSEISCSNNNDFMAILKQVNGGKLKVTQTKQLPTKPTTEKLLKALSIPDPNEITFSSLEDTGRVFGLYNLLWFGSVLSIKDNTLILGPKAKDFLALDRVEQREYLFKQYMQAPFVEFAGKKDLAFCTLGARDREDVRDHVRARIADLPVEEWVDFESLSWILRLTERDFFRNVGRREANSTTTASYAFADPWKEQEEVFINSMVIDFLNPLGILDVLVEEDKRYSRSGLCVRYLRLTKLGAYILHVISEYYEGDESLGVSQLVIQPNFEILVTKGAQQDAHSLFLETIGEASSKEEVSTPVYTLSFSTLVRALDEGLSIQEDILPYLEAHSKYPIPDTVLAGLADWEKQSRRIRIRHVCVLECEDPYLLEELRSYRGISRYMGQELSHAVTIKEEDAKRIKREIEKKKHFCVIDPKPAK